MLSGKASVFFLLLTAFSFSAVLDATLNYVESPVSISTDLSLQPSVSGVQGLYCVGDQLVPSFDAASVWLYSKYSGVVKGNIIGTDCVDNYGSINPMQQINWMTAANFDAVKSDAQYRFNGKSTFVSYISPRLPGGLALSNQKTTYRTATGFMADGKNAEIGLYCKGMATLSSNIPGYSPSADYLGSSLPFSGVSLAQQGTYSLTPKLQLNDCFASGMAVRSSAPACSGAVEAVLMYKFGPQVSASLEGTGKTITVEPKFACAISATNPSVSPNPVASGQSVSFSFTITNSDVRDISVASLALQSGSQFSGLAITSPALPFTIPKGGSVTVSGTATAPIVAAQTTVPLRIILNGNSAQADCEGTVKSCTDKLVLNVQVTVAPPTQKPDYVPLITAPQNATVGVPFSVSIITRNIGAGNATNSSTTRAAFESAVSDFAVAPLASDAQQANTATFNCTSTGAKAISVTVDLTNRVDESNESNNFASATVDCVQQPGGQPNYVPLLPASQSATVGQPFFVSVTTRNIGDAAATAATTTRVRFESSSTNLSIAPLAAGAQDARAVSFTCQSPGAKQLNATVDATGAQPESNEGDNFASMTINCQAAPLPDYIPFITAPPNATVGVPFSATITTRNIGNGNATNSSVTRATFESAVSSFQVAPLTAGAQQADAAQFTCTSAGQKTISASADFGNSISESNEANNAASATVNCLAPAGFSLACSLVGHDSLFYPNESAQVRADCLSNGQPTACPALNWSTDISGAAVSPTFTGAGPTPQSSTFYSPATQPSSITNGQVAIRCANPLDCSATCSVSLSVSPRPDFMVCSLSVPRPGPPYQFLPSDNSPVSAECTWNFVPAACPALNWGTTVTGGSIAPSSTPRQPSPSVTFFTSGAPVQSGRTIGASSAEPDTPLYCAALIQVNVVSAIGPDYVVSAMRKPSLMVEVGRTFEVEADVSNIGNRNATDNSLVHFDAGCVPADQQDAPLLVGQARTHIATCTCSRAGIMPITANADYYGSVTEYDENNNARTVQVQCGSTFAPMCADYV